MPSVYALILYPPYCLGGILVSKKKKLICQWCERMYLCGFVALSVRMCVAGASKVEGTMS